MTERLTRLGERRQRVEATPGARGIVLEELVLFRALSICHCHRHTTARRTRSCAGNQLALLGREEDGGRVGAREPVTVGREVNVLCYVSSAGPNLDHCR